MVPKAGKYPLMSMSKSVLLLTKTLIGPPVAAPFGTIASFPTTLPFGAFSVDTVGSDSPAGHVVRYAMGPTADTVIRSEYTWAAAGIAQELCCTGKLRVPPPTKAGGPKAPLNPNPTRVSAMRQGVTGVNARPCAVGGAKYPLISISTLVLSLAKKLTAPFVPA